MPTTINRQTGEDRHSMPTTINKPVKTGTLRRLVCGLLVAVTAGALPVSGQWINEPGTGWLQVALYHHDTRQQFGPQRDLRDFPEEGHAVTTSVSVTASYGIVRGLDTWVQLPVHRLRFDDFLAERTSVGLGDPLIHLRIGPEAFGISTIPVALRAGIKLPGGDFPVDAEIIPLGEGQRDYELMLELGHSFWPAPIYAAGWVGYRWREENREAARKPGNEWFAYASLGGSYKGFVWKVAMEAIRGGAWEALGITLPTARRQLFQITPSVGRRLGPGAFEVGGRFPIAGQNYPAGAAFTAGYFTSFRIFRNN